MNVGQDVIDFRERRHMSRKALADASGLTEGKVWRIEKKGHLSDDERRALTIVGVVFTTDGLPSLPPPPPTPEPNVDEVTLHVAIVDSPPTTDVDWATALASVKHTYDRYVSNSELQTFKRCRRKWWLAWHRGLVLKSESPIGVRQIGDRLHRALKVHYSPEGGDLLAALEREIALDTEKIAHRAIEPEEMKQFTDEANLERIMLEGYLEWTAETGHDADIEIVAAETYLEHHFMDWGDVTVAIIGKIDVRIRRKTDGARLFLDHKSVANLTQPVLMLPLDEQMKHYHLLERSQDEQDPTVGALYNMLRRVKRTARANPPFFSRVEVRHNEHELTNYETRLRGEISDMLDVQNDLTLGVSHQLVAYPRPTRDCVWDCPFFAVCPMFDDGSRAEDMLTNLYTQRNPLEYYMEEILGETE